ncbi:ATP-binding protein [Streptomyces sp. NPDC057445]|uniref:ATP-binding protein n=1 Tax=Streptomyces sp. NPDC057445 TaxID=3346136 RepID=UPI0036957601
MSSERIQSPEGRPAVWLEPNGLRASMPADAMNLRGVRRLIARILMAEGLSVETADAACLVLSELVGNAVRACGDGVLLTIELRLADEGVVVAVTDPDPSRLPHTTDTALDSAEAESGRGLALIDALCTEVSVRTTSVDKQVRCVLPAA